MTLYELLRSIASYDAVLDYLFGEYLHDPGTRPGYQHVIAELLDTEPRPHADGGSILVQRHPADEINDEPHWRVSLEDEAGQRWSAAFVPWAEFLLLNVAVRGVDLTPEQTLAHILWEITFYGWTAQDVDEKSAELKDSIAELEEKLASLPESPTDADLEAAGFHVWNPGDQDDDGE